MEWRDYGFAAAVLAAILPTMIWLVRTLVLEQMKTFHEAVKTFETVTTEERGERIEMVRQFAGANGAMQQVMAAQGEAMRSVGSTLATVQTALDSHRSESAQNYSALRQTMKDLYTALVSEAQGAQT